MPIINKKRISKHASVAVWQITEPEDFFLYSLHLLPEDEVNIKNVKLLQHRLQKFACRMALAELLSSNNIGITYTDTGQPLLKNHHISFSHTNNVVVAALSNTPVGIDIEKLTPRIAPLYSRFMNSQEIGACNLNNLRDLYYYWCAKEAMYKWYAQKSLDFIEDLFVEKNEKKGMVCNTHTLQLVDFCVGNHLIVVCF